MKVGELLPSGCTLKRTDIAVLHLAEQPRAFLDAVDQQEGVVLLRSALELARGLVEPASSTRISTAAPNSVLSDGASTACR